MKLAELSNNSFERKNVTFWGSKHTLTPPTYFQGSRPHNPQDPRSLSGHLPWRCLLQQRLKISTVADDWYRALGGHTFFKLPDRWTRGAGSRLTIARVGLTRTSSLSPRWSPTSRRYSNVISSVKNPTSAIAQSYLNSPASDN